MACCRKSTPVHAGHALVGQEERNRFVAFFQLRADVERGLAGSSPQDAMLLSVFAPQILDDRLQDRNIVIDGKKDRLGHRCIIAALEIGC